jgi:hypothetical protein
MFAGRNASCTHAAMSSTRVMGTCCGMGQAAGTAAALAVRRGCLPAEVGGFVGELQQTLLRDDAYIPWVRQEPPALTARATLDASTGDPEPARDGVNRPVGDDPHCWPCRPGDWIAYRLPRAAVVNAATLILDSGLDQNIAMSGMARRGKLTTTPAVMPKTFRLEGLSKGRWRELVRVEGNRQRLRRFAINETLDGVRFTLDETWGSPESRVYGYWLE